MYAIIAIGGTQQRIEPGQAFETEHLNGEPGDVVRLDDSVLMLRTDTELKVGQPSVPGATVDLEILDHSRGKKLTVFKMKRRKRNRCKQGHRQELTRVLVKDVVLDGTSLCQDAGTEPEPTAEKSAAQATETAPAGADAPENTATETQAKGKAPAKTEAKQSTTEKAAKSKSIQAKPKAAKTAKKSVATKEKKSTTDTSASGSEDSKSKKGKSGT